ncbi:MAG TPA: VWA domain-containing protein [Verrucomicrobiae bacterium]|nr:VWA domain-containing protein [Verrucomicrobiae bacterium]
MPSHHISAALCLSAALVCLPAVPQQKPAEQETKLPQFRTGVTEVIVPVTVSDDKGRFVSNLTAKDFRLLDEGKPQRISFFSHSERQPVVIGFLIDQSNSTRIHWKTYQDAILELVWNLLPGDKKYTGYLVQYANEATLLVNTTWDSDKLADKIRKMKPGGGSSLFDAVYMACMNRDLVKGEPYEPRRVMVIVGDGHDNASKHTFGEVLELAQRNLTTIYAVSTMAFGFSNEDQDVLEKLTTKTGGHVEYPLNGLYKNVSGYLSNPSDDGNYALTVGTGGYAAEISNGIIKAVGGIGGEITTQYVLRYTPDFDPEGKPKVYRKITVDIPGLPNVKIRAREGYYPEEVPLGPATAKGPSGAK